MVYQNYLIICSYHKETLVFLFYQILLNSTNSYKNC